MNKAKLIRHIRWEIAFTRVVIWMMEHPASMASAERDRTARRLRQRIQG